MFCWSGSTKIECMFSMRERKLNWEINYNDFGVWGRHFGHVCVYLFVVQEKKNPAKKSSIERIFMEKSGACLRRGACGCFFLFFHEISFSHWEIMLQGEWDGILLCSWKSKSLWFFHADTFVLSAPETTSQIYSNNIKSDVGMSFISCRRRVLTYPKNKA